MPNQKARIEHLESVVLRQTEQMTTLLCFLERKRVLTETEFNFLVCNGPFVEKDEEGFKEVACPLGEWESIDEFDKRFTVALVEKVMEAPK